MNTINNNKNSYLVYDSPDLNGVALLYYSWFHRKENKAIYSYDKERASINMANEHCIFTW